MSVKTAANLLGPGLLVVVLAGCAAVSTTPPVKKNYAGIPPKEFTINVGGTEGLKFTGELVVDGESKNVTNTAPASYQVSAHELNCSLKKSEAAGRLSLEVHDAEKTMWGSCETGEKSGGVHGEIRLHGGAYTTIFNTF